MTGEVRNLFVVDDEARRYARARPYYHERAVAAGARLLGIEEPVALALDLGAGTGLSSRALRTVAQRVVALDVSAAMLTAFTREAGVHPVLAAGEVLPLAAGSCDLAAVASCVHWLDLDTALPELWRVLRPDGALLVYLDVFTAMLRGQRRVGVRGAGTICSTPKLCFGVDSLTQTNALAVLAEGEVSAEELAAWIEEGTTPFFPPDGGGHAVFNVRVWALRLVGPRPTEVPPATSSRSGGRPASAVAQRRSRRAAR